MRLLVTGATGFLGWRTATLLAARGHDVTATSRPGGRARAFAAGLETVAIDVADPTAGDLVAGRDAVLHFAGMPDPRRSREDPARAVRENAGTTVALLDACERHGAGLVYPSTIRAGIEPSPDAYALSKRLGEEACRLHGARAAVVRLTSVFGPGQVAWDGATGAISAFAARALRGEPIVIPGDPARTRDFVFVDDLVDALEALVATARWDATPVLAASGTPTALADAARLVVAAAGADVPIQTPGGALAPGEDASYEPDPLAPRIPLTARPLAESVALYVDWLASYAAAEGRPQA
ncbi:MAG: NAD-dependent epimerase/dehydratase family protein [Solirubrobacteraceae bacterium]